MTKRADCAGCVSDEVADPNTNSEYLSLYITAFGLAGTNMDIGVSYMYICICVIIYIYVYEVM